MGTAFSDEMKKLVERHHCKNYESMNKKSIQKTDLFQSMNQCIPQSSFKASYENSKAN